MDPIIEVEPQTHSERCLYWARIFEKPHAAWERDRKGRVVKVMVPPSPASLLVARTLRFYAASNEG